MSFRKTTTSIRAAGPQSSWFFKKHPDENIITVRFVMEENNLPSNEEEQADEENGEEEMEEEMDENVENEDSKDGMKEDEDDDEEGGEGGQQQIFILTRDGGNGIPLTLAPGEGITCDSDDDVAPKLIHVEGEGGQRYVLAISGDSAELTEMTNIKLPDGAEEITLQEPRLQLSGKKRTQSGSSTSSSGGKKPSTPGDDVTQAWFTTRDDKAALQNKGHTWKQGQWTKDEIDLLEANINQYCNEHNIYDPRQIIFERTKDERKDFYRTIAKGLQRPLFSVYRRVTRMYDKKNHIGKYTPEEVKKLRELRNKLGPDWAAIGSAMGRSASSVKDKCRLMKDTCNSGKWLPIEEERLAKAVYELAGVKPGENVTHGLSWAQVAEHVETRSEKQCRTKWLNYLNWKQKGGTEWTRQDDINLICKVESLGLTNEADIDWPAMAEDWPSVRSPQWLRGKWWSLKRHVPDYNLKQLPELVDILKTLHIHNVRLKPLNLSRVKLEDGSSADIQLQLPLLQAAIESGEMAEGLQAFEVLQQWPATSNGTILIAQPQGTPISIGGTPLTTDIILQALPGTGEVKGNGNVTVQMNPSSHIIISAPSGELGPLDSPVITTAIPLTDGLETSDQDLNDALSSEAQMVGGIEAELEEAEQLPEQAQLLPSFHAQTVSGDTADEVLAGNSVDNSDIIASVSVTSPHHFPTTATTDNQLMHDFSDPILTSDTADLMNSSDVEGDKTQGVLSDDIQ